MEQFGPYRLLRCIAVGGMGELFLAHRAGIAGFSKQLVVKRIRPAFAHNPEFVSMFLNEGRVAALLDHPNLVHIYELGEVDGKYFLAMEYVPGKNLGHVIQKLAGPLPLPLSVYTAVQLCEGLAFAHSAADADRKALRLVHRDVSPPNVLISYSGAVKLTDFGIAKVVQSSGPRTAAGVLKGKFAYLSPEQARGEPLDKRSDIFSLGLVLYEITMAARAIPGEAETEVLYAVAHGNVRRPSDDDPDYPPELEQIYLRATAKDRADRYRDAKEIQEDLIQFQVKNNMVVTAGRMGSFMQSLFEQEAKAEGEWVHETTVGDADPQSGVTSGPVAVARSRTLELADALARAESSAPRGHSDATVRLPEDAGRGSGTFDAPTVPSAALKVHDRAARSLAFDAFEGESPAEFDASLPAGRMHNRRRTGPTEHAPPAQDDRGFVPAMETGPPAPKRAPDATGPTQLAPLRRRPSAASNRAVSDPRNSAFGDAPTIASSVEHLLPIDARRAQPPPRSGWRPLVTVFAAATTLMLALAVFVVVAPPGRFGWVDRIRSTVTGEGVRSAAPAPPVAEDASSGVVAARDAAPRDLSAEDPSAGQAAAADAGARLTSDLAGAPGPSAVGATTDPQRARLRIVARPPMVAYLGDRRLGLTPLTTRARLGPHKVRLKHRALDLTIERKVVVRRSGAELEVELGKGFLVVQARPWADVHVDGKKRGTTPMTPIALYEGKHQVMLTNTEAPKPYTRRVTIEPDKTVTLSHHFGAAPSGASPEQPGGE